MASPAKVAANKRNARRSTGPRTPAGRARSAGNALRHGLRAATLVLPGAESVADWEGFRAGIVEALAPVGALELDLSERVAALSWRLRRVTRFEAATLSEKQGEAEHDAVLATVRRFPLFTGHDGERTLLESSPFARGFVEDLEGSAKYRTELYQLFDRVRSKPDTAKLEPEDAADLVRALADQADLAEWNPDGSPAVALPGVPPGPWEAFDGWTAGLVRAAAEAFVSELRRRAEVERAKTPAERGRELAELRRRHPGLFDPDQEDDDEDDYQAKPEGSLSSTGAELWQRAALEAAQDSGASERRAKEARVALEHLRGKRSVPAEPDLDRVLRYESHLQRQLSATLSELERVRRLRPVLEVRPEV